MPTQPTGAETTDPKFFDTLTAKFVVDNKLVIEPEMLKKLSQALHEQISTQNLYEMRQWKQKGNINAFVIAYTNLLDQLNQAYKIVDITQPGVDPSVDSLEAGARVATTLLHTLQERFLVPPSLVHQITFIADGLRALLRVETEHPVADDAPVLSQSGDDTQPTGAVATP